MAVNKDIELKSFFIFNSLFGPKEGEELQKLLYYYPTTDNTDIQIESIGLVEGIIKFTETFSPSSPVGSLHTAKFKQLYFQPEPNYWIVMSLTVPIATKTKENITSPEYLEDDLQENVYSPVLKQMYYMYRLFWGTLEDTFQKSGVDVLKGRLETFFNAYLKSLKIEHVDILSIFRGMQYLPLDKQTFLKVQCFVNALESKWQNIAHSAFLYNEHVIWSGVEPNDMQMIYQYLIGTLLPANVETELQGGSMPRNSPSPFSLCYGRFITGPTNLKQAKTTGKIPKIYFYSDAGVKEYHLVVYRALSATVCLFIEGQIELKLEDFKSMDEYINPKLTLIVNDIAEYCSKQVVTPSNIPESTPKYIYFNKLNLAYKSTVHLDNKQSGNIACSKESLRIMADMNRSNSFLGPAGENIVKTTNDYWVFSKTSNLREFYIVLQQKNASLIGMSEEVKRLCETELGGIFFHPM
ncbi:vacuolar fusion protein CCZ1 homolog [Anthonomus grandis grandis]|uniref:vacuolar fusion protein CCZ1 homolog n=1 Tax=Anthonomus grandis grandis TaxID=2921223 RepID=UPI0021653F28|nr:vacuolar fusion protein CCZ1 homolog [Anthonomus grandis grandis]